MQDISTALVDLARPGNRRGEFPRSGRRESHNLPHSSKLKSKPNAATTPPTALRLREGK